MSRSYRHTPITGIGMPKARVEHWWKRLAWRKLRHENKLRLKVGWPMALLREVSDTWGWPKDGKCRFNAHKYPTLMRK